MNESYDIIIAGAGMAGLSLAKAIANSSVLQNQKVLLIDATKKNGNDRTWCFWEEGNGEWDNKLTKKWPKLSFADWNDTQTESIAPFHYKMLRSNDFYSTCWQFIERAPNITFLKDNIKTVRKGEVITEQRKYSAKWVFKCYQHTFKFPQRPYHFLWQHFSGWWIEMEKPIFSTDRALYMDLDVTQSYGFAFMYLLPLTKTKALVEFTLFSQEILADVTYEERIEAYLSKHYPDVTYKIVEKEKGKIPMTDAFGLKKEKKHGVITLGTFGGEVKASTGFAFLRTQRIVRQLVKQLEEGKKPRKPPYSKMYLLFDAVLLRILDAQKERGDRIFSRLFRKNKFSSLLRFLDEQASFWEILKIMNAVPKWAFTKAFFKELFSGKFW